MSDAMLGFDDVDGVGIVPLIDGCDLREVVDDMEWFGLTPFEAAVTARMLQGWRPPPIFNQVVRPPELALEPGEWRGYTPLSPNAPDISLPEVRVVLPGGDAPVVSQWDFAGFHRDAGAPVLSCSCGGGVGCNALEVRVTTVEQHVVWDVRGGHRLEFTRERHAAGVRALLVLAGEAPILIDEA
jgi:hypothetical protein